MDGGGAPLPTHTFDSFLPMYVCWLVVPGFANYICHNGIKDDDDICMAPFYPKTTCQFYCHSVFILHRPYWIILCRVSPIFSSWYGPQLVKSTPGGPYGPLCTNNALEQLKPQGFSVCAWAGLLTFEGTISVTKHVSVAFIKGPIYQNKKKNIYFRNKGKNCAKR